MKGIAVNKREDEIETRLDGIQLGKKKSGKVEDCPLCATHDIALEEEADFYSNAPEDIRYLLDRVAALRKALSEIKDNVRCIVGTVEEEGECLCCIANNAIGDA